MLFQESGIRNCSLWHGCQGSEHLNQHPFPETVARTWIGPGAIRTPTGSWVWGTSVTNGWLTWCATMLVASWVLNAVTRRGMQCGVEGAMTENVRKCYKGWAAPVPDWRVRDFLEVTSDISGINRNWCELWKEDGHLVQRTLYTYEPGKRENIRDSGEVSKAALCIVWCEVGEKKV